MSDRVDAPVYAKIALDLASKIAAGEIAVGSKISGRSGLAGLYHVSPETIRRAMLLLEDIDIVRTRSGSGIFVISREQAVKYVERHHMIVDFQSIRDEIRQLNKQKDDIEARIAQLIEQLEEQAARVQNFRPVYPYEVTVPAGSPLIGKTINESKFWQNTNGTIVAIKRGLVIINSPGPYAQFIEGDVLYITGETGVENRSMDYLKNG